MDLFTSDNSKLDENYPITGIVNSHIPKSNITDQVKPTKTVNYIIDSRDRNRQIYPSPSKYVIPLSEEYRDIKEIELLSVQLPKVTYTINKNNDQLKLFLGDECCNLSLIPGRFEKGKQLAKSVETSINDNRPIGTPNIRVDYLEHLHKLIFRSPNIHQLGKVDVRGFMTFDFEGNKTCYGDGTKFETKYPNNSCGEVLGFEPGLYDMYCGKIFINPIDEIDNVILDDEAIQDLISDDVENSPLCEDSRYTKYVIRGDNILLSKCILRPITSESLTCNVDYVYLCNKQSNFIPAKVISKYTCSTTGVANKHLDSWVVEIDRYWNITHGHYELFTDYIVSNKIVDLTPHKYVLLKIPRCHRFQSIDKDTQKSFAKIPLQTGEYHISNLNAPGNIKGFNPPLPLLDKLEIQWLNYSSNSPSSGSQLFDFVGGEHVLEFAIVYHRQPLRYSQLS